MIDEFKDFVAEHPSCSIFVDNIKSIEDDHYDIISYLFDGYMLCYVIFDGLVYWDIQDREEIPAYFGDYKSYRSLNLLLEAMDCMLTGDTV